jgi:hypothetical protein
MMISAYERDTGKRVACISGVDGFNAGLCLRASLANRYECDVDDLRFEEGSDGNDYITTLRLVGHRSRHLRRRGLSDRMGPHRGRGHRGPA